MLDQPFHCPSSKPDVSAGERLALHIYACTGNEPVRTLEAIAAVVANQVAQALAKAVPVRRLNDLTPTEREQAFDTLLDLHSTGLNNPLPNGDPRFAACLRIARRAISGALRDPTDGATRCHPIGSASGYAKPWTPTAWIGGFLFYREDQD